MLKQKHNIILASGSPRRSYLLEQLGLTFEVIKPNFQETFPKELPATEVPLFLAKQKIRQIPNRVTDSLYITSDTVVVLNNTVIGKPKDIEEAKTFLTQLSGNTHKVVTGVCLSVNEKLHGFSETTDVTFYTITSEEIDYYLSKFQPLDKAGSYGIQEWIGHSCIEKINGSFDNVVGLPASKLYQELKRLELLF